jgi:hypothetical protein
MDDIVALIGRLATQLPASRNAKTLQGFTTMPDPVFRSDNKQVDNL